jgi:hypothetical protein
MTAFRGINFLQPAPLLNFFVRVRHEVVNADVRRQQE